MPPKTAKAAAPAPKTKAPASHASYQDMITEAILSLRDRNGSSRQALKKYVRANNQINVASDKMFDSLFNKALKNGVDKGVFNQPKGPSGGTKLAKKTAPPPKEVKEKKEVEKKETKEPKEKKAVAPAAAPKEKKPAAPKKAAAAPKKAAATKEKAAPAVKKAAPKKAAPKKEVAAAEEKPAVLSKTKSGRVSKAPAPAKPAAKKAAPKKAAAPKKEKTPKKAADTTTES